MKFLQASSLFYSLVIIPLFLYCNEENRSLATTTDQQIFNLLKTASLCTKLKPSIHKELYSWNINFISYEASDAEKNLMNIIQENCLQDEDIEDGASTYGVKELILPDNMKATVNFEYNSSCERYSVTLLIFKKHAQRLGLTLEQ